MSAEDEAYKVHVANLPFNFDHRQLENLFISAVGDVRRGLVIHDRDGRSKGFGFVTFNSYVGMQQAITKMHGRIIDGRDITVTRAIPKEQMPGSGGGGAAGGAFNSFDEPPSRRSDRDDRYNDRPPPDRFEERYRGLEDDSRGRGGPIRDLALDRSGAASVGGSGRKHHPPGFRVAVSGLPPTFTWKELKDFLRTGSKQVTYADVKQIGFGFGEWASERERQEAIRQLDGRIVDGYNVRVRAVEGDEGMDARPPLRIPPEAYAGGRPMGGGMGGSMGAAMGGRALSSGYGNMDSYRSDRGGYPGPIEMGMGGRYADAGPTRGSMGYSGLEERERIRLRERDRDMDREPDRERERDRYYDNGARSDSAGYAGSRQPLPQCAGFSYAGERGTGTRDFRAPVSAGAAGYSGGILASMRSAEPRADPRWDHERDAGRGYGAGGSGSVYGERRAGYGDDRMADPRHSGGRDTLATPGGRYLDEPRGRSDAFSDRYAPSSGREADRDRGFYGRERDAGPGHGRGPAASAPAASRYGASRYAPY